MAEVGEMDRRHPRLGEDGKHILPEEAREEDHPCGVPAQRQGQDIHQGRVREPRTAARRDGARCAAAHEPAVRRFRRRGGALPLRQSGALPHPPRNPVHIPSEEHVAARRGCAMAGGLDAHRDAARFPGCGAHGGLRVDGAGARRARSRRPPRRRRRRRGRFAFGWSRSGSSARGSGGRKPGARRASGRAGPGPRPSRATRSGRGRGPRPRRRRRADRPLRGPAAASSPRCGGRCP